MFRRMGPPGPEEPGYIDKKATTAIIDTGAQHVCIDHRLAHALNLSVITRRPMRGATGTRMAELYTVWLKVPALDFAEPVEAWSGDLGADRGGYAALLGRSFLKSYFFGYDGPAGVFYALHARNYFQPPPDDDG